MSLSFAETLRRLRLEKGLSQQQLASILFVDRSSVAHWEIGRRVPDAILISRLAEVLDADVATLLSAARRSVDKPNVILLDDEKIILSGGLPILEQAIPDAAVTGFTKPSKALDFARDNPVSLAFLDIEMGTVSGLAVCRELLKLRPRCNVVFLTAYMEYSYPAWDTGACGFLLKPLTVDAVRKQLTKLRYPFYKPEE